MRVVTLGGLGQSQRFVLMRQRSDFRGLGHVPGATVGDALTYMNEIVRRYQAALAAGKIDEATAEKLDTHVQRVMALLADIDDTTLPVTREQRSAVAKLDNEVYFALGQWYKVPWIWWAVGGTVVAGFVAWWAYKRFR